MRIVSWNCRMKFRDKYKSALAYNPDIMIIPECENLAIRKHHHFYDDFIWVGDNPNKGLGVLTLNSSYRIKVHSSYNENYKWILPLVVSTNEHSFILIAVWTKNHPKTEFSYIGQLFYALTEYSHLLTDKCIIIGDFNSNAIWDRMRKKTNHSIVVKMLESLGIKSLYHEVMNENHGEETLNTYLHNKPVKGYHIDYCFVSNHYLQIGQQYEFNSDDLSILPHIKSDHVPLIVNLSGN